MSLWSPFYRMVPIFMQTCHSLSHLISSLDFYFFHKLCSFLPSAFQQNSWEEFIYLFVPSPLQLDSPTNHHFYQIALSGSTVISTLLNPVADFQYSFNLIITNIKHTSAFLGWPWWFLPILNTWYFALGALSERFFPDCLVQGWKDSWIRFEGTGDLGSPRTSN